jgi:CheY-like chemotaxis protein
VDKHIRRILAFSRPADTERRPIKLGDMITETVKLLNATLPSYIEIVIDKCTEDDVVLADATEMHQVIMNLGTNAGHAMRPRGGKLEYQLDTVVLFEGKAAALALPAGPYVHLRVSDTGHGMNREVQERIFDPFFTTKAGRGTGLGLTLVQKIVTRSDGRIIVESREGEGTTFHIYLPKSPRPLEPCKVDEKRELAGKREKILVVDDEIPLLNMMQQRLRLMGYRVITRADSPNALETVRAEPQQFAAVITDHTMPVLQGADLCERIGDIRTDLPVILMTGLNQPPSFANSPYASKRSVIHKPINFVELSHRLRFFLD